MKTKMPTLSEATRVVYKRRKNGTKSATNFLIGMKHNIKALGDLPVNKITRPMVNKMMDILKQERSKPSVPYARKFVCKIWSRTFQPHIGGSGCCT